MRKEFTNSFILGGIVTIIVSMSLLYVLLLNKKSLILIEPIVEDSMKTDSCNIDYNDPYYSSKEFIREMYKGAQGDLSSEEMDSIMESR